MPYTFGATVAMDLDLVNLLVAAMLDVSSNPLFYAGFSKTASADKVALFTGILQPMPDDAGFMLADEVSNLVSAPRTAYDCQLTIRAKDRTGQTGQNRATAIAKQIVLYLRPDGEDRCQVSLPSGRRVMSFNDAQIRPVGQDLQERYTVAVTFKAVCEGDQ